MPKELLTEEVAAKVAALASNQTLATLKIDQYKSGKNKGHLYAQYTEGERPLDINTINALNELASSIKQRNQITVTAIMEEDTPPLIRMVKYEPNKEDLK